MIAKSLKWDGSNITQILNKAIKCNEYEKNGIMYWLYEFKDEVIYFEVKKAKDLWMVIIDEIKPIFKLSKINTHHVINNKEIIILIKTSYSETKTLIQDHVLSYTISKNDEVSEMLKKDENFRKQIQDIYSFRNLIKVKSNSSIRIRILATRYYPISINESTPNPSSITNKISRADLAIWFDEKCTPDMCIKRLTHIYNKEDMVETISIIRKKLNKVFHRLDPTNIQFVDHFIGNIIAKLQYILE